MVGIWYFSGTGKCKYVATQIATSLSSTDTEIKDITPLSSREALSRVISYDKLVLVFPVYAGDVPNTLKEFLTQLNGNDVCTILIALWGNVHSGEALINTHKILSERNFRIIAGAEMIAEHSFHTKNICLAEGRPTENEIAKIISFVKTNIVKVNPVFQFPLQKRSVVIRGLMKLPQSFIPRKVIQINIDSEKCIQCGLCQKICPVDAITSEMRINPKTCIRCLSCETNCPTKARTHSFTTKLGLKFFARNQKLYYNNQFFNSPS